MHEEAEGKIRYALGVLRTHTPGGKAIVRLRRRKEGGEGRYPELRDEGKETARCLSKTICKKHGQGGPRTITLHGI